MERIEWNDKTIEGLTVKELLSADLIRQLYEDFEDDPLGRAEITAKLTLQARSEHCRAEFEKLIKGKEKAEKEHSKSTSVLNNQQVAQFKLQDGSELKVNTGKWSVNRYGVRTEGFAGPLVASNYPIIITRTMTDLITGKEDVELTWRKDNVVRSMQVPRSFISSNTKIVQLSDNGVPVTSSSANLLINYLADFEVLNPNTIEHQMSTRRYGWVTREGHEREFLPYSDSDIKLNYSWMDERLVKAISSSGNISDWLDVYMPLRSSGRQDFNVVIAASLASVLVDIVGISPFIVNLYGHSGGGKTVTLLFAASVWGNPQELKIESNSTVNALVRQLGTLNNLPLLVDDMSKINDKGDGSKYTEFVYTLCAGREKSRLSKSLSMRDSAVWSNAILTNMERPLASEDMNGGALNRVLDFEMQEGNIFEDGNGTVKAISKNYGLLGELFVNYVIKNCDEVQGIMDEYEAKIREEADKNGKEMEQKQITPMALILTADEFLGRMLGDDTRLDIPWCVGNLRSIDEVSEPIRAWNYILDAVNVNSNKFHPNEYGEFSAGCWGYEKEDEIDIIPSVLEKIAKEHNFSLKQFIKWADNEEILIRGEGHNIKRRVRIPGDLNIRCYAFRKTGDCSDSVPSFSYHGPKRPRKKHENEETIQTQFNELSAQEDVPF